MKIQIENDQLTIMDEHGIIFHHDSAHPSVFIGRGSEKIEMYRGNFDIQDEIVERVPLRRLELLEQSPAKVDLRWFSDDMKNTFDLTIEEIDHRLHFQGRYSDSSYQRIWLRLPAKLDENIYGGGEQFSCFNLRGKNFPIWTSEQGVGRNKSTYETFLADVHDRAGGDYYWTFFPQATFISSEHYYCHLENTCYSCLDFRHENYHELHLWSSEITLVIERGDSLADTLSRLTVLLGRQPVLPDWCIKGAWLGIQGGTQTCMDKLAIMKKQGTDVTGIWCQDWQGIKLTSFGKRLHWNWQHNPELYPGLKEQIKEWLAQGIHFMGYINPYVLSGESLFEEARTRDYLAKTTDGSVYLVDFGEFDCGIVDLTNPQAFHWYKNVIKKNLIEFGLSGWMADFGEYLPIDCVLYQGDAMSLHNKWPALWAQVNYEAIAETGNLGNLIAYHRAGAAGSQKYALLMWAGDQNVDWSIDDGLISVVVSALSMGMTGHGLQTSDIGGYTTLFHMKRTKELFMRWAEFCAFTPVMRTHEGNRPADNWQFDSDMETILHFAWCSRIHTQLSPYMKQLVEENSESGIPVMRPLVLHYEKDPNTFDLKYQYMLGEEMIVAPVYIEGTESVNLYLPEGQWNHLWNKEQFGSGFHQVHAPIGQPAVFYRQDGKFSALFDNLELY